MRRLKSFMEGEGRLGGCIQQEGEVQTFCLAREPPLKFPPFVGNPDLSIRNTLRRMLGLVTVMILKGVNESILFQSSKFTECKIKDKKEVTNSLMSFSLLKIIYP